MGPGPCAHSPVLTRAGESCPAPTWQSQAELGRDLICPGAEPSRDGGIVLTPETLLPRGFRGPAVSQKAPVGGSPTALPPLSPQCSIGQACAVKKGARIGRLCDCPRGATCNAFLLKCL
uniref:Cocaine- and amphetamine-regulated transcript protein n=1 Tax=Chrysemys picta bellii TaxID=8478 RepID=A0A8C3IJN3_CHRPI